MNDLASYFPLWGELEPHQRRQLEEAAVFRTVSAGTVLHRGMADCIGLLVLRSGQLRAYILSEEGKEVTLYRLFDGDVCLFSASCMLSSIQFDLMLETERETGLWVIPTQVYQSLTAQSAAAANFTSQLMASRFSEVMWLVEQILFKSFDKRLAAFLIQESSIEERDELALTHEKIAHHLGTAREVVTRMLKYFQSEGMVRLSRGGVTLIDRQKLLSLAR